MRVNTLSYTQVKFPPERDDDGDTTVSDNSNQSTGDQSLVQNGPRQVVFLNKKKRLPKITCGRFTATVAYLLKTEPILILKKGQRGSVA